MKHASWWEWLMLAILVVNVVTSAISANWPLTNAWAFSLLLLVLLLIERHKDDKK